jgi:hypothetical protein
MVHSSHERRSDDLFRKSAPDFFAGGPKIPHGTSNPHESQLRNALNTQGRPPDLVATALTSYLSEELRGIASTRPSDHYAKIGMMVGVHVLMNYQTDEIMGKIKRQLKK